MSAGDVRRAVAVLPAAVHQQKAVRLDGGARLFRGGIVHRRPRIGASRRGDGLEACAPRLSGCARRRPSRYSLACSSVQPSPAAMRRRSSIAKRTMAAPSLRWACSIWAISVSFFHAFQRLHGVLALFRRQRPGFSSNARSIAQLVPPASSSTATGPFMAAKALRASS